jgi:hypothetical protein
MESDVDWHDHRPTSDRELLKAGKVPLRVIGSWDDFAAISYAPIEVTTANFCKLAGRSCARDYLAGNMTMDELRDMLKKLGLMYELRDMFDKLRATVNDPPGGE